MVKITCVTCPCFDGETCIEGPPVPVVVGQKVRWEQPPIPRPAETVCARHPDWMNRERIKRLGLNVPGAPQGIQPLSYVTPEALAASSDNSVPRAARDGD